MKKINKLILILMCLCTITVTIPNNQSDIAPCGHYNSIEKI